MKIYQLSGIGDRERIAISGITLETCDQLVFMNPDDGPNPLLTARHAAADKWPGLQVFAERGHDKRVKSYFQDAIGPGFSLPGCDVAVSEHAREVLAPILGDHVRFLPLDIVGAPCKYWAFYVTKYYYGALDETLTVFSPPYSSAPDRRKMLRAAAFKSSKELEELFVFRVPGTVAYVVPDITYATQNFFDLVAEHRLGGFNFLKIYYKGFKLGASEEPVLTSTGPEYGLPISK